MMREQADGGDASRWLIALAVIIVMFLGTHSGARANGIQSYAVFGNSGVTFDGYSTVNGIVGSNADIDDVSAVLTASSLSGVGNFNGTNATQSVAGAMRFNGSISGGTGSNYGSVDAGGNVTMRGNVAGNITTGGDLFLSTFNHVGSSALVNGNATLSGSTTVSGTLGVNGNASLGAFVKISNLVYGGLLSVGTSPTIGTQQHGTVNVEPQVVSTVFVPAAASFVGGGADQNLATFGAVTLTPGHYGAVNLSGGNSISLSAGNYYFDSIHSAGAFLTLNLDLTGGDINIFVAGDVNLLDVTERVNGLAFDQISDPTLASKVYLESEGNVAFDNVGPTNGSKFFGTIFTPSGTITTGAIETIVGSLLSGQGVVIGGDTNIKGEVSDYVLAESLPEPVDGAMVVIAGGMLAMRRKSRSRADIVMAACQF